MNFLRIARTSRALVRPLLGGFQVLACCAATLIAQDSGLKEATFLGLMQNPGVTSGGNPTDSKVKPFMPTIDPASYKALKDAGAASPSGVKPGAGLAALSGPRPLTLSQSFTGIDRFGAADQGFIYTPPDVNTATGNGQVVEVTNNHYTCFDPSGIILQDTPASVFFGYNRQLFTDPRVVYDTIWNRWIVGEVAFPENPTTMIFFLAVSQTPDCTGPFYVYTTNERTIVSQGTPHRIAQSRPTLTQHSNSLMQWDPDVVLGAFSVPFDIMVTPNPTITSSTLSIIIGTSTLPAPAMGAHNRITATVVNNVTSSTLESIWQYVDNLSVTSTFSLAPIPEGSYTITIGLESPLKGSASTSKSFSI